MSSSGDLMDFGRSRKDIITERKVKQCEECLDRGKFCINNFLKERRFYTSAGNPVKEILLKLNLPDHRIFKDGGEG
ncbi:hypothetical protein Tco_0551644 [Tanacetum coccineum]